MLCSEGTCPNNIYRRDWCRAHYARWLKYGDPTVVKKAVHKITPPEVRFQRHYLRHWRAPDDDSPCWVWLGQKNNYGYGNFMLSYTGGKPQFIGAHRFSYMMHKGPIADGLTIDHLCRNRLCVNPDHLEAVTLAENISRSESVSAVHARKTHCNNGHEFTPENTYIRPTGGRDCRICRAKAASRLRSNRRVDAIYLNNLNS